MIGFLLILGGCVALVWWAARAWQRQNQERYDSRPTAKVADRWSTTLATDRQLDYIESLLDSTGLTLSVATRGLLGRSVSMDGLTLGEASELIDYLKELPGERQRTATRRRAAPRERKVRVAELRPLLNRTDVLVVDVETTGFGDRAEVLAVAVIDTTGRVLLDTVSMPQGRIPTDASNVHGLTRSRLRSMGALPWPKVHRELVELLRDASVVVAWNVEFDRRLLHQTAKRHGLTLPGADLTLRHGGGNHHTGSRCSVRQADRRRPPPWRVGVRRPQRPGRCPHHAFRRARPGGRRPRVTDRYAELDAEIARLHGDLDFERDVAEKARAFSARHPAPTWWTIPATSRRNVSTNYWPPATSAPPPSCSPASGLPIPAHVSAAPQCAKDPAHDAGRQPVLHHPGAGEPGRSVPMASTPGIPSSRRPTA